MDILFRLCGGVKRPDPYVPKPLSADFVARHLRRRSGNEDGSGNEGGSGNGSGSGGSVDQEEPGVPSHESSTSTEPRRKRRLSRSSSAISPGLQTPDDESQPDPNPGLPKLRPNQPPDFVAYRTQQNPDGSYSRVPEPSHFLFKGKGKPPKKRNSTGDQQPVGADPGDLAGQQLPPQETNIRKWQAKADEVLASHAPVSETRMKAWEGTLSTLAYPLTENEQCTEIERLELEYYGTAKFLQYTKQGRADSLTNMLLEKRGKAVEALHVPDDTVQATPDNQTTTPATQEDISAPDPTPQQHEPSQDPDPGPDFEGGAKLVDTFKWIPKDLDTYTAAQMVKLWRANREGCRIMDQLIETYFASPEGQRGEKPNLKTWIVLARKEYSREAQEGEWRVTARLLRDWAWQLRRAARERYEALQDAASRVEQDEVVASEPFKNVTFKEPSWEAKCVHVRLPGEVGTEEGRRVLEGVVSLLFGIPRLPPYLQQLMALVPDPTQLRHWPVLHMLARMSGDIMEQPEKGEITMPTFDPQDYTEEAVGHLCDFLLTETRKAIREPVSRVESTILAFLLYDEEWGAAVVSERFQGLAIEEGDIRPPRSDVLLRLLKLGGSYSCRCCNDDNEVSWTYDDDDNDDDD